MTRVIAKGFTRTTSVSVSFLGVDYGKAEMEPAEPELSPYGLLERAAEQRLESERLAARAKRLALVALLSVAASLALQALRYFL